MQVLAKRNRVGSIGQTARKCCAKFLSKREIVLSNSLSYGNEASTQGTG